MARYTVTVQERDFDIEVGYQDGELVATINGEPREITAHSLGSHQFGDNRFLLLVNNRASEVDVRHESQNDRVVLIHGMEVAVTIEDFALHEMRKKAGITAGAAVEKTLKAPMPGLIVATKVEPGQTVKKGDPLLVVEAMKMENIIKAKGDVTVKAIRVQVGQSVEKNAALIDFE